MADKTPAAMPPASEPFPGSRTPGWNDPPTITYNPLITGTATGRTRLNLNKRVAYPLQGTINAESSTATSKPTAIVTPNQANSNLPPPSTSSIIANQSSQSQPVAVVYPMSYTSVNVVSDTDTFDSVNDTVNECFTIFKNQIPFVHESTNVRRDEIERRLCLIEQMWQSGALSIAVKHKIYQISQAIIRKQYSEAMEIYTNLVVNHATECASWAVTLRHIILTVESASQNLIFPTATTTTTITTTLGRDNNIHSLGTVPTMFVPGMPRSSTTATNTTDAPTSIAEVQHI